MPPAVQPEEHAGHHGEVAHLQMENAWPGRPAEERSRLLVGVVYLHRVSHSRQFVRAAAIVDSSVARSGTRTCKLCTGENTDNGRYEKITTFDSWTRAACAVTERRGQTSRYYLFQHSQHITTPTVVVDYTNADPVHGAINHNLYTTFAASIGLRQSSYSSSLPLPRKPNPTYSISPSAASRSPPSQS